VSFSFEVLKRHHRSRLGRLTTPHGVVETPAFIFCATKASIKGLSPVQMRDADTQIILANTYHLLLQPGGDILQASGGLHRFMGWNGPLLTDSGGFQIFSLGHGSVASEIKGKRFAGGGSKPSLLSISEEGACFRSYVNGERIFLSPESSIFVQHQIGADLVVVLDECTPFHVDKDYTAASMERSHRWALRSQAAFEHLDNGRQKLYGIVQGGVHSDLRRMSSDFVKEHPFFGIAVGGSLGASRLQMQSIVTETMQLLDTDRPVHLLGIGSVEDIFHGVMQGLDTFDCVHPTRLARHGGALIQPLSGEGMQLTLKNARFKRDQRPLEEGCPCSTCQHFSRAYLHHLIKAKELLFMSALSIHNVTFMNRFLAAIRRAIAEGRLADIRSDWIDS
jgi:queuine tRNA-ribosyltransferase